MTDRELLEMAAKAAKYEIEVDHHGVIHHHEGSGPQSSGRLRKLVGA